MKKLLKPLFTALFAGMVCTGAKAAEPQVINIRTNDLSMVMSVARTAKCCSTTSEDASTTHRPPQASKATAARTTAPTTSPTRRWAAATSANPRCA